MITIRKTGVVGRVFRVAHLLWRQFRGDEYVDDVGRTDLCTFIRTILVGAPLAVVANIASVAFAIFATYSLAVELWLILSTVGIALLVITLALAALATAAAFAIGAFWAAEKVAGSETLSVIAECYRAKKAHICPFVNIDGGDHAAA